MIPPPPPNLVEWLQVVFYLVTIAGAISFSAFAAVSAWTSRVR